jgi:trans-aconitate methyltransferase
MSRLQQKFVCGAASVVVAVSFIGFEEEASAQPRGPKYEAPFVTSANETVHMLLKTAGVTAKDTVYDLGCGDGRIVIAAAQHYGARGVGVDKDPRRIRESRRNAVKAGVNRRTIFRTENLFATDLRGATVVTLYLGEWMNLQLRPKLLRELRPGARVVSHNFGMGDWKPDQTVKFTVGRNVVVVHLWTIPETGKKPRGL